MKNDRKHFRPEKKFYKKKFDNSEKTARPFEKFRRDKKDGKPHFEKEKDRHTQRAHEGGSENRKPHRTWQKPSVFYKNKRKESKKENHEPGLTRLNKYIANAGICSRREADKMIEGGLVSVNGKIITQLGTKISSSDIVKYGGETLRNERKVYVLLNKPKDYITTVEDTHGRKTVMELIQNACKERIYPVGRLDRKTTGILLLTNDGELTKKLTHPSHGAKKIYHVETDRNVDYADLKKLTDGITLEEDGIVKADEANYAGEHLDKNQIGIVLHSGKNRVVRRMFESLGYKVLKLDRVLFAGLTKKDLPRGRWRYLSEKEVGFLKMIK